MVLAPGTEVH